MAYRGRDIEVAGFDADSATKSIVIDTDDVIVEIEGVHNQDEAIPLTQEDEEAIVWMPEVYPSDSAIHDPNNEDDPQGGRSSTDPHLSDLQTMGRQECVEHLSTLHDEVEKMFEMPKKFDIVALSSNTVVHDRNRRPSEVPEVDGRHFDEYDYATHRRVSFPHIHQPLRSLSNKSLKTLTPAKVKKKKKKKKKKPKLRSFPSKGALKSPPIPEEAEEDDDEEDEVDESSEDDVDGEEDKENYEEGQFLGDQRSDITSIKSSVPDIQVGFFIGDSDLPSPSHESKPFPTSPTPSAAALKFRRTSSQEPEMSSRFTSVDDEPQVSQHAANLYVPAMKQGSRSSGESGSRVKFMVGPDSSESSLMDRDEPIWIPRQPNGDVGEAPPPHTSQSDSRLGKNRRKHHHHHEHFKKEHLIMRRQKGSEVHLDNMADMKRSPTETDEASMLQKADLDNLASHRFEDVRGIRRHKINRHRNTMHSIVHIGKLAKEKVAHKPKKKVDHTPHEVFVELDRLHVGLDPEVEWEWREKARWIKFEEDVEEGAERWGKPHVASLSFHSLLELRRGLERGTMLLDLEASDLQTVVHRVVENMTITDQIREEDKGRLIRTLLLKHKHVSERSTFLPRNVSYSNLVGLDTSRHYHQRRKSMIASLSTASFSNLGSHPDLKKMNEELRSTAHEAGKLEMVKVDLDNNMTDNLHIGISTVEPKRNVQDIMRRIPAGAEASIVLVGNVDFLEKPAVAFVRLEKGEVLDNLTEVPLPTRFIIILLGPENSMDYHEVGRSISTLMANQSFHEIAYRADSRLEILHAINSFLDDSIVLPPGDWDQKTLLPIMDMARKRANVRKRRKKNHQEETDPLLEKEDKPKIPTDPLVRTRCLFGGLINDVRRRYPHYASDFRDFLNLQCGLTLVFIFFACLSPCIAFGGLLSEKTNKMMGVSETVVSTSLGGIVFGLFCGQPLLIIGPTGPVLVFEQSLYKFCDENDIDFLTFRCWIGFWVFIITTATVAAEGSFLIRYVTRFTEEIFAILISLIFIYEVIKKLDKTFAKHPLSASPCLNYTPASNYSMADNSSDFNSTGFNESEPTHNYYGDSEYHVNEPNTALLSTILVLGTFLIAYFLRIFRNSKFLGRSARRALGDFGILIALILMVLLDYMVEDTYTQKLQIKDSISPTSGRSGWFVNPLGAEDKKVEVWMIFAAIIPAFLIFILLFMEIQLTEVILNKKDRKLRKGSGFHLDQFIMGVLTFVSALFGLPWMCAATVRTIAHTSSLSVFSRTHAPGEKPKLLYVIEQRVTNIAVSLLIGLSLFLGPLLREIPVAVLFGVFLYLGVSSLGGVQFFQRIKLLLMPVKHHPDFGFVRRVRTLKMHLFTIIQLVCLVILWVVKSTQAALAFPFVLLLLIPLRGHLMTRVFNKQELHELDKEEDESDDDEDEPDFYDQVHMPI